MTPPASADHAYESRDRFAFGRNWLRYAASIGEPEIAAAMASIRRLTGETDLLGKRLLDAGSGSGLFSLAARRLGARVHSFDYDPDSVACTQALRQRFATNDPDWTVTQGSLLDENFLESLGQFDLAYCWGVIHHTGDMYGSLSLLMKRVAPGGSLYLAVYNDQKLFSRLWWQAKRLYTRHPALRPIIISLYFPYLLTGRLALCLLTRRAFTERGMSLWHDMLDWLGGFPFETARPENLLDFCRPHGFILEKLKTCGGGQGCNEFVFRKTPASLPPPC